MFELTLDQRKKPMPPRSSGPTLDHLLAGESAIIERIVATSHSIRQRLLEMGLTRNTPIEVIRFAPLGDPIEIAVRGYRLSLRRAEARLILVRKEQR